MKNLHIGLLVFGITGVLIIYFQNTVFITTAYTPFGITMSSNIVIFTSILGIISGYSLCSLINNKKDDLDDDF